MKLILLKLYFISLILSIVFLVSNCGTTPQLPAEVCEYTNALCDYSDTICDLYPESCFYVNIVCTNLALLCDSSATDLDKRLALERIKVTNSIIQYNLKEWQK